MRLKLLLAVLASVAVLGRADNIRFQWNPNPEEGVTGYILDYSKDPLTTNLLQRTDYTNWLLSVAVPGRLTTNQVIQINGNLLIGTNWFYLTAIGSTNAGTNVFIGSNLSAPVTAVKGGRPTNFRSASVHIESSTNLMAMNWTIEEIIPIQMDLDSSHLKFYRALMAINATTIRP